MAPAPVIRPICQEFGVPDGRTLSVLKDIARKSPVIIMMTMSIGVNRACPVMSRPMASRSTCAIFLIVDPEGIAQNALERDPTHFDSGDDAAKPGPPFSTTPAADLATSVAVDTAMPICGLTQCWSIVGAIAAHTDRMPTLLKRLHQIVFSFRKNASEYRKVFRLDALGKWSGGQTAPSRPTA